MDTIEAQVLSALKNILSEKVQATGTPSEPYLHGPAGLFGVEGLERDLFHTRIRGNGLAAQLPVVGSRQTDPLFAYITGYRDVTGSVADGVCDDGETAGPMKTCIQSAPFGRYTFKTRELEVNRVGQLINRGEFDDLRVLNDPIAPILGRSIFPDISGASQLDAGAEVLARMLEVGIAFVNRLGRQLYVATPANNSAGGGYKEFQGLDILIGTTKVDALTGQDCPSLHSDVKDFDYNCVDDPDADPDIVRTLTTMFRYVNHIADNTGLSPATWTFVMRTAAFWELADVWACQYWSSRCNTSPSANMPATVNISGPEQTQLRDSMRQGRYLLIDGMQIPVVLDDFILEESSADTNRLNAGSFASDIYLVPLTVLGGMPVTFFQYYDYRAGTMRAVSNGRVNSMYWTDNGRYLWTYDTRNWCVVWETKTEPRLVLRTPHIAGRLTNVCYTPLQHPRDVHPDDPYFVDGGTGGRPAPSLWNDWTGGVD